MNSSWISQQGMENLLFMDDHYDWMDPFDEDYVTMFEQDLHNYICSPPSTLINNPIMVHTPDDQSWFLLNENPKDQSFHQVKSVNEEKEMVVPKIVEPKKKRSRSRPPSQTYDHIIAERKRREQLSQLFVALSALVPGLKKMDKSSVLEDAIKYLKDLQERVKKLEEKAEKHSMESAVVVKKSQILMEVEDGMEGSLPEIEARVCKNQLLVKVQCEKQKGILVNLLCKIESLDLMVVSTNATPFGNLTLDITIVAEMEKEFNLMPRDVVEAVRSILM